MKCESRNKGFTVMEFMIVVSIVGVLYASSLPNVRRLFLEAKRVEMLAMHRAAFNALHAGLMDLEQNPSLYSQYIGENGNETFTYMRVTLTKDGADDDALLQLMAPGLTPGVIKSKDSRETKIIMALWPHMGYDVNPFPTGTDWSSPTSTVMVINCKYHVAAVQWYAVSTNDAAQAAGGSGWNPPTSAFWINGINAAQEDWYGCDDLGSGSSGGEEEGPGPTEDDVNWTKGDVNKIGGAKVGGGGGGCSGKACKGPL